MLILGGFNFARAGKTYPYFRLWRLYEDGGIGIAYLACKDVTMYFFVTHKDVTM